MGFVFACRDRGRGKRGGQSKGQVMFFFTFSLSIILANQYLCLSYMAVPSIAVKRILNHGRRQVDKLFF
jgi:hypothetical protein